MVSMALLRRCNKHNDNILFSYDRFMILSFYALFSGEIKQRYNGLTMTGPNKHVWDSLTGLTESEYVCDWE